MVDVGLEQVSGKTFSPWAHSVAEAFFEGGSEDGVAADPTGVPIENVTESLLGVDGDSFVAPTILNLKEITIFPKQKSGRGPHRITCKIDVVITSGPSGMLASNGEKTGALMGLLKFNVRSFFRQLLEEYGSTITDAAAKERFQSEAKLRLNLLKVQGDEECQKYIGFLRGHVLQVIINEVEQPN